MNGLFEASLTEPGINMKVPDRGSVTNFWWANQNNSYEHDLPLGILWAPLRNKRGHRTSHWESMDRVRPGDVVFHYANQEIRAVSCVLRGSMPADRPYPGGDAWHEQGRSIQTVYDELDAPLPLQEIPLERRTTQRFLNSAFKSSGGVNEGYLWDLSQELGIWLSDRLGLIPELGTAENALGSMRGEPWAYFDETDRKVVVNARKEQSALRDALFKDRIVAECALCGRSLPVDLLATAHIKERSACATSERNDPNVVMAACILGCDSLFEKHYIVVDEGGFVRAGNRTTGALADVLEPLLGRRCGAMTPESSEYFSYHRKIASKRERRR